MSYCAWLRCLIVLCVVEMSYCAWFRCLIVLCVVEMSYGIVRG
jgi:hypothetical protein